jgi:transcriptional regulator with XRE-family HTH domain
MITGSLCKAARALVGVSRYKLAANSGVDTRTVELFERGISAPDDRAVAALQSALEALGPCSYRRKARMVPVSG